MSVRMRMLPAVLILLAGWCRIAAAQTVEVPFEFVHNQIVLRATINAEGPFNFIVDTGTLSSTIDLQLARRLRLPVGPPAAVTGAGTRQAQARRTICDEVRVGGLIARGVDAVMLDLSAISRVLQWPLHGVFGYSLLKSRIVQIDYPERRIRFLQAPPEPPREGMPAASGPHDSATFAMQFQSRSVLPILEDCAVNGVKLPLTLDTGSSMGLVLFPGGIERLGLADLARAGSPLRATGYRGPATLSKGWVRSLQLKSIDLGAIEVSYVRKGYGDNEEWARRGGNLGNMVLQDFIVTLDYPNAVVRLDRPEE